MTVHHIITENHQKHVCIYCKTTITGVDWQSEFYKSLHYKTSVCSCGKRLRIKVKFMGSGHDEWGIDSKVNKEIEKISRSTS